MRIVVPRSVLDLFYWILRHAEDEVAGLLLGTNLGDVVEVRELILCENSDNSPYSFRLNPYAVLEAYSIAERYGLEVVALIHSHPAAPYPSGKDVNGMRLWCMPWVIVDSRSYSTRVWRLAANGVVEVGLDLI